MIMDVTLLEKIVGPMQDGSDQKKNAMSFLAALNEFGSATGLDAAHRLAHYIGQIAHESHNFIYDREIWGDTRAQLRYDIRTDLGNTPERDGDGYLYRGRTGIQITGKANYRSFRDWARKLDPTAPDFVADPDAVNLDPWEGLGPIWYWSTRGLNKLADEADIRGVTRRINGGFNGLADRQKRTDWARLVLLGFSRNDVRGFQVANGLVADGKLGPITRAKLHEQLQKSQVRRAKAPSAVAGGVAAVAVGGGAVTYWENIVTFWHGLPCNLGWISSLINACGG